MKKIALIILFSVTGVTLFAQNFYSESDVYNYLNGKKFINSSVNSTIEFSEMGSVEKVNGNYLMMNPEITVISTTRAIAKYYSVQDPSIFSGINIDCSNNTITDRRNGRVYALDNQSFSNEVIGSSENGNSNIIIKDLNQIPKVLIGTFIGNGIKVVIEQIPFVQNVTYKRGFSFKSDEKKWDLRIKVFLANEKPFFIHLNDFGESIYKGKYWVSFVLSEKKFLNIDEIDLNQKANKLIIKYYVNADLNKYSVSRIYNSK